MQCPNCGYNNQPNNRFCVRCGIDIAAPPSPETPSFDVTAPPPPGAPAPNEPTGSGAAAGPPPNPWGAPPAGAAAGPGVPLPPSGPYPGYPAPNPQDPNAPAPNPFAPPPPIGAPGTYPPPGAYGQYPAYPPPGLVPGSTNGLATAALILGTVGWIPCGVGSLVAIILGFIARNQIRESRGRQGGDGLALAGIILGFVGVGIWVLLLVLGATLGSSSTS